MRRVPPARGQVASGSRVDKRGAEASRLLEAILLQDVEVNRDEAGGTPQARLKQETNRHRICSVTDPEIRHGRKSSSTRFDGHKLSLAAEVRLLIDQVERSPFDSLVGGPHTRRNRDLQGQAAFTQVQPDWLETGRSPIRQRPRPDVCPRAEELPFSQVIPPCTLTRSPNYAARLSWHYGEASDR
jgi:hypothetical protein